MLDLSNSAAKKARQHSPEVPDNYCGPCYGAKPQEECCNSCEEVQRAYADVGWSTDPDNFEQVNKKGKKRGKTVYSNAFCYSVFEKVGKKRHKLKQRKAVECMELYQSTRFVATSISLLVKPLVKADHIFMI